ncbi:MAG: type III restriction endonuclease subunit R, partial [Chloroflexota bacterium]
ATPPVMISVCNRTETAARVKHAFENRRIQIDELCDAERTLHIDSKVLAEAEAKEEPISEPQAGKGDESGEEEVGGTTEPTLTKAEWAERLRQMVDTVGKIGQLGEQIRHVISVGMLSEGWDAKTVTHIMGLRAFTSQLLCEQVVGRGLRRTAYEVNPETGLFEPEYVNIFGVPFTFLPHEDRREQVPSPPAPRFPVYPDPAKGAFALSWPNVVRIEQVLQPVLHWDAVEPLELDATSTPQLAELAPIVEGKPDVTQITPIDLDHLAREMRLQRVIFETARDVFDQLQPAWRGAREVLLAQVVRAVEQFIRSEKLIVHPHSFNNDEVRRRLIITLNMSRVVRHLWRALVHDNTERLLIVLDQGHPIGHTGEMRTWYTAKPCEHTKKSHINVCVYDSTWEASDAYVLDTHPVVKAWAKNDHLGFEIYYLYRGVVRKYRPDYLVRLVNGLTLIVETKGQETDQDQAKRDYLSEWVKAVNADGRFGRWGWAVTHRPGELHDVLVTWASAVHGG